MQPPTTILPYAQEAADPWVQVVRFLGGTMIAQGAAGGVASGYSLVDAVRWSFATFWGISDQQMSCLLRNLAGAIVAAALIGVGFAVRGRKAAARGWAVGLQGATVGLVVWAITERAMMWISGGLHSYAPPRFASYVLPTILNGLPPAVLPIALVVALTRRPICGAFR